MLALFPFGIPLRQSRALDEVGAFLSIRPQVPHLFIGGTVVVFEHLDQAKWSNDQSHCNIQNQRNARALITFDLSSGFGGLNPALLFGIMTQKVVIPRAVGLVTKRVIVVTDLAFKPATKAALGGCEKNWNTRANALFTSALSVGFNQVAGFQPGTKLVVGPPRVRRVTSTIIVAAHKIR